MGIPVGTARAAATLLAVAACLGGGASSAAAAVPPGFFGVVPQGALSSADMERMDGVVETLRLPISWSQCEPSPGVFDFAALDAEIGAAAEHGVRVLPFVSGTPAWISPNPALPPLGSAGARQAWASFLRTLVGRYGPGGSFWEGRGAAKPIHVWQVWNEPNFVLGWRPHPSPAGYARLLRIAAGAIRGTDPHARIALAGVAPVNAGMLPWVFLRRLYRVPGVQRDFDFAAVHPYGSTVSRALTQIQLARQVMEQAGDRGTPLLVSELGVASTGAVPSAFVLGAAGQAAYLREAFARLVAKRRAWHLAGVDWFAWQDEPGFDPHCSFCEGAGLFALDGAPKPAWFAYRRAVAAARVR
jgi:hypothetical protein